MSQPQQIEPQDLSLHRVQEHPPERGGLPCPMCGGWNAPGTTACAECGERLTFQVSNLREADVQRFRSETQALGVLWMILMLVTGYVGIVLADQGPGLSGRFLGVVFCFGGVGFIESTWQCLRFNPRGGARGCIVWGVLMAVQLLTLPIPWQGTLWVVFPQVVIWAVCVAQFGRIKGLERRIRAAGLPLSVAPQLLRDSQR